MRDALKAALSLPEMASLPTVFRAFSLASSGNGEANERAAWESIERRKRDLLERSEVIEMIDYGAGDRNDVRTEQQQRSGVSPISAALAQEAFSSLNLGDFVSISVGPFRETLETCLQSVDAFDLAFIDGHHDGNAMIDYFDQYKTKFLPGSIIVFDDVDYSKSMERAWRHVTKGSGVLRSIRVGGGSSRDRRGIVTFGNKA